MTDAPSRQDRWTWFALCIVLTAILSFITARLPVHLQKPAITAIWLGGLIGAMVSWLAQTYHVQTSRRAIAMAVCLGVVATVGVTGQRYYLFRQVKTEEYLGDLNRSGAGSAETVGVFPENTTPPPSLREQFRAEREAILEKILPFDAYLQTRLAAFSTTEKPYTKSMAIGFWIIEFLLAGVAAGAASLMTAQVSRSTETSA